ncbi:MAG: ATPase [Cyanobacteria bacterium SBLK]|nr:ATPase [Cyanobacteria bacterium SBLK]
MTIARTICLGFLGTILIGTLLLTLPISTGDGTWNDILVALFTSTSAVCVTGLIVVDTGTHFSAIGQFFILLLIQIGGLGYMTSTTFLILILRRKFDLRQKFAIQEAFDRPFLQGSRNLIRSILATTFLFELTGVFLMANLFAKDYGLRKGLWLAIFHSISAWNNAGFSLFADSLVGYRNSWTINIIIPLLIIFGGIGYQTIIEFYIWYQNQFRNPKPRFVFSLNFKVVVNTTLILLGLGWVAFLAIESLPSGTLADLSLSEKVLAAWFQSVTTRTAGFNTVDFGAMTDAALFITMGLMIVGASPSGTGGGIKTTTVRILFDCTRSALRDYDEVIIYGRKIASPLMLKAIAVVFGSGMTVAISTAFLVFIEGQNFEFIDLFFETISAFATVGVSTGITAALSTWGQLVIIVTMFIGRVGILVFIAALFGESCPRQVKYPEENLLVG